MTTTTTTTTPTTTTTTTTYLPISVVEVVRTDIDGNELEITDASDNANTINTPFAKSFSFGAIGPGQLSTAHIIFLRVPKARSIGNIKLALRNTGGIVFANNIFGVTKSSILTTYNAPTQYFQGINIDDLPSNAYNISIDNRDSYTSDYVYLFLNLPLNNTLETGLIKYKWYFDYAG